MRLLTLAILIAAFLAAPSLAAPSPPAAGAGELVVVGRLKTLGQSPYCGVAMLATVGEYEVLKVISGDYSPKRIFVAHLCIEMLNPKPIVGRVYRLVLVPESVAVPQTEVFRWHLDWHGPKGYKILFLRISGDSIQSVAE